MEADEFYFKLSCNLVARKKFCKIAGAHAIDLACVVGAYEPLHSWGNR